ncbi:MAG: 50S ribosomal protein L22 [Candidatus Diapherotrites archaeon]|nr:50S ribosomal protein L22 [Candidatus Diapherotrites archaeon]
MKNGYQEQIDLPNVAKAMSKNRPVSVKYATEICREIKGKPVQKALNFLQNVIDQKDYLPMRKFVRNIPHRKGQSKSHVKSGRFPVKACKAFIELINSAKHNAEQKGLNEQTLMVRHAFASYGFKRQFMQGKGHIGGKSREHKSAHIEVILQEMAGIQKQAVKTVAPAVKKTAEKVITVPETTTPIIESKKEIKKTKAKKGVSK